MLQPKLGGVLGQAPTAPISAVPQRMAISQPGDSYEREADQVAERVLEPSGSLERDQQSRALRYDLSQVRIHTDAQAAESARAVNALAYTVGHHIVFGNGLYSPRSEQGLRLLVHELAHTAQQTPVFARKPATCLDPAVCADVKFPSKLLEEGKKESGERREKRKKLCAKRPPDPGCRADRHGDRAVETENLLRSYDPSRLSPAFTKGIFIDRDLEKDFSALVRSCNTFTPPIVTSGLCITVPIETEDQAKEFNTTTGPRTINGKSRDEWREKILEVLVHEAEHTRFGTIQAPISSLALGAAPTLLGKRRPTCSKNVDRQRDVFLALNELGSMLQEFPMRKAYIKSNVALSKSEKDAELEEWRDHRIRGTSQSITVSLRTVRCLCGCGDANELIRQTIEFATSSWTQEEKAELDLEMSHYRWNYLNLDWPFGPAAPKVVPERLLPEGEEMA